ncbi:hypothetical protein AB664_18910 [Brucella anthropi]|uniref:Condensation domain-containing protein n=1 Tax=Brucella anthropi TaxID=529 RepID=A0A656Z2B9_BRUAN|nr:hypothetical protein AB664_18910 [Brucella anthropi]
MSTQQGIWFADQVATRRNAYVIAHAIELSGMIDLAHLEEAIGLGLSEADTVMAQYGEDETGAWQMTHAGSVPPVDHIDVSTEADPEAAARRFMQEDIDADLDVNGKRPLCYQALIHLGDSGGNKRLFWYQRYHHVMLDGFSFTALTRRVADIYSALSEGHAVTAFPFRSVSEVIEERVPMRCPKLVLQIANIGALIAAIFHRKPRLRSAADMKGTGISFCAP